jgi:hypothetical protein
MRCLASSEGEDESEAVRELHEAFCRLMPTQRSLEKQNDADEFLREVYGTLAVISSSLGEEIPAFFPQWTVDDYGEYAHWYVLGLVRVFIARLRA